MSSATPALSIDQLCQSDALLKGITWLDTAKGEEHTGDIALRDGTIVGLGSQPEGFTPQHSYTASELALTPKLTDLCARLAANGASARNSLSSELLAAQASGIGNLVCPPTLDPILDTPDVVEMLRNRASDHNAQHAGSVRVHPLGALTLRLEGNALSEAHALLGAGCIGLTQADQPLPDTIVLQRALQYAASCDAPVWLYPQDAALSHGVAASGDIATRLGLAGIPVAAETIALFTTLQFVASSGARVHFCRISSAAGVELIRQAKADGLNVTCDVSIHSLHLTDQDIGYYDSACRLNPPLRQQRDRDALQTALADGTIDALVSDHTVIGRDAKILPFAQATPGATGMELLLPLALRWGKERSLNLAQSLAPITHRAAQAAGLNSATIAEGTRIRDLLLFNTTQEWEVNNHSLRSRSKTTPFAFETSGFMMKGKVVG